MKNILGINVEKESDIKIDGDCFVEATLSDELNKKLDSYEEKIMAMNNKYSLPKSLVIIKNIALFFAVMSMTFCITISGEGMIPSVFNTSMKTGLSFLLLTLVIFIILKVYEAKLNKQRKENIDKSNVKEEFDNLKLECLQYLEVPDENIKVDFFAHYYKTKNTKKGLQNYNLNPYIKFMTFEFYVYKKENKLYISDCTQVIAIDIDDIEKIYINKKRVNSFNWNKEKDPKEYGVSKNNQGIYIYKEYCSMIVTNCDAKYELCFPLYELDGIKKLTGKTAEEIKK